ncbi:hypothetical protein [Geobacillus thermoleovorans]|uniref:hypothetical protein n=1 Tax=Geobacillus thermoleovorans TaxID=33941 RepID=UPI003DA3A616
MPLHTTTAATTRNPVEQPKDSLADPELRELVDWMYDMKGEDFDPDAFDVEEANERLAYIRL